MAGDSGSPFTITFGSGARVVKRSGVSGSGSGSCCSGSDSGSGSGSGLVLGSKRSFKDRLETKGIHYSNDRKHYKHKRQKDESHQASWNKKFSNDAFLGKGDLRHKILKKNLSRESKEMDQSQTMDLRDKLSRRSRNNISPGDSNGSHPTEATHDTKKNILDARDSYIDGRQSVVEHRTYDCEKQISRGLRDAYPRDRESGPEFRDSYADERQSIREHGNAYNHGRQGMLEHRDSCESCDFAEQCVQGPRGNYDCGTQHGLGLAPSPRTGSNLTTVDLVRNSSLPWAVENLRQRSPDRILRSTIPTPFFLERNVEEMQKVAMISPYSDGTLTMYRRTDILSPPRTAGFGTFCTHPASHAISSLPARPMPSVAQYPQPSGFPQNIPYAVEPPTVASFLQSLGLEKYIIHFMAEEVDFNALRQMTDADLKELSIPMGPRKKIIQALTPQLRR